METDSFPGGVRLTRSPLGGHAVEWNGKFIGWIHASYGDKGTHTFAVPSQALRAGHSAALPRTRQFGSLPLRPGRQAASKPCTSAKRAKAGQPQATKRTQLVGVCPVQPEVWREIQVLATGSSRRSPCRVNR
jgi:hypothetical protein